MQNEKLDGLQMLYPMPLMSEEIGTRSVKFASSRSALSGDSMGVYISPGMYMSPGMEISPGVYADTTSTSGVPATAMALGPARAAVVCNSSAALAPAVE